MKRKYIVKRGTHAHTYDERKVYGSVYAACYVAISNHKQCEHIAGKVVKKITSFVHKKKAVASTQIFHLVILELRKHNKDAAFMYETHRDIA